MRVGAALQGAGQGGDGDPERGGDGPGGGGVGGDGGRRGCGADAHHDDDRVGAGAERLPVAAGAHDERVGGVERGDDDVGAVVGGGEAQVGAVHVDPDAVRVAQRLQAHEVVVAVHEAPVPVQRGGHGGEHDQRHGALRLVVVDGARQRVQVEAGDAGRRRGNRDRDDLDALVGRQQQAAAGAAQGVDVRERVGDVYDGEAVGAQARVPLGVEQRAALAQRLQDGDVQHGDRGFTWRAR